MKKKFLALLLAALMVVGLLPITVFAAYTNTYEYKCGPTEVVVTDLSTATYNQFKLTITQKAKNTAEYNKETLYNNTVELILNPEEHSLVGTFSTDDYSIDANSFLKSGSNSRYVSYWETSTITIVSNGGNKYAITGGLLQVENSTGNYLYTYDYCYAASDLNNKLAGKTPFEFTFGEAPAPTHAITNGTPESDSAKNHGYITVDETAAEGETVTVKVNPADGYQLKSLTGTGMSFVTVDPSGTTAPNVNAEGFGGSTVRNGNFFGHNFDYYINGNSEVVIKTEADPISRPHAVIGVANPYSLDVTGTAYDAETLKQLAWLITDGINDAGLVCSINGVSTEDIKDKPHSHTNDGAPAIMVVHLVREILNVCGTVGEAKTFIEAHDITPLSADWDAHIMIADATNTVIVEFTEEGVKFVEQDQWIMTDFYNHLLNEEGFLTNHRPANFPNHSIGMERYWVLSDNYNISNSILGTMDLLKKVSYTKTYDKNVDPFWCSEFFRTDMIPTFGTYPMEYWTKQKVLAQDAPKNLIEKYAAYEADGTYDTADGLKHTAHSSVYSIKDKTLTLSFGDDQKYIYTFDGLTNPEITPEKQTDGTYQFKMPAYAVTVTAEFEKTVAYNYTQKKEYASLADAMKDAESGDEIEIWVEENDEDVVLPLGVTLYTKSGYTGEVTTNENGKAVVCDFMFGQFTYKFYLADALPIVYKDKGGATFSGTHEAGYPSAYCVEATTILKSASKTGYTFDGWFDNENCEGEPITGFYPYTYSGTLTLYAKWTANTVTVSFDKNGGDTEADSKEITETYGAKFVLPSTVPTREGYLFNGWYTDTNGGTLVTAETVVSLTENKTLYAHWTEEELPPPTADKTATVIVGTVLCSLALCGLVMKKKRGI